MRLYNSRLVLKGNVPIVFDAINLEIGAWFHERNLILCSSTKRKIICLVEHWDKIMNVVFIYDALRPFMHCLQYVLVS